MCIPYIRYNAIQIWERYDLPRYIIVGVEAVRTGKDDTSPYLHNLDGPGDRL